MEQNQVNYPSERMSIDDFKLFRRLIYSEAGINLTEKKITLLSNRIRKRLKELNINSYNKYYQYLKKSLDKEAEIVKMINVVTTNVTHFFRNPKQFDKFNNIILPEIVKRNYKGKKIKILSAGCSTGEEAYTIAIILLEYFKNNQKNWDLKVDGVDISTDVLEKAHTGIYKKEKMKEIKDKIFNKYFIHVDNDLYKIKDKVKSITKFKHFNLKADEFTSKYDVIFCRNVVIYFDKNTKEIIYNKFNNSLEDGGYFLIGHSEGMFNDKRFKYSSPGVYIKD